MLRSIAGMNMDDSKSGHVGLGQLGKPWLCFPINGRGITLSER